MPGKPAKADPLFATSWVHVFEEDNAEGSVYRSEDDDTIPLSRRPRQRLALKPDGSAHISVQGPDDRYIEEPARWTEEKGALVIRAGGGARCLRIIQRSPSRLVIKSQKSGSD